MLKLSNAKVGDRLSFRYNGGSQRGKYRTINVTEVHKNDGITGIDLNLNEVRRFKNNKATDIAVMTTTVEPKYEFVDWDGDYAKVVIQSPEGQELLIELEPYSNLIFIDGIDVKPIELAKRITEFVENMK